jgi:hypothetical protein
MRRENPVPCFDHQILAVVDLGDKADYRPEVRFSLSLSVPFRLTGRSGIRQLQEAYQQVFKALSPLMTTSHRRLHVWLIDAGTGQPTLFLSGLLGVRQGQLTKNQAERRDAKIRPQVTCPRPTKRHQFLLNTTAHSWGDPEEFDCEEDASDEDREYAVLDGIFGGIERCEFIDADHADVDYRENFSVHRGAWKVVRNECVVFGNDCFSDDIRSQIQVARLVQELESLGVKIKGFGISKDGGYTWALRVAFKDDYLLDRLVWHIWFVVFCGMEDNPARAELNERLKKLKRRKAA